MKLLSEESVIAIHERVINENELQGMAKDKSLASVLMRVINRLDYGLIEDVFDLSASYAVVIARGHVFNDANKRTAFQTMLTCLVLNGQLIDFETEEIGQVIIDVAQGKVDETELANYLRKKTQK